MLLDEKSLIKRCLNRDPLAQKYLYDLYSKKLYGICLRYGQSDEEAQDILQDSFVKIFTKLDTFQNTGSFEGWMKRIVSNTAIEYYRKRIDIVEVDEFTLSPYLSSQADTNLETEELLKLIQNLPDGYRIVFNMYAIEGYNHGEIALKLGISEGTSKSQYSRAKVYLQKKIEEKYKLPRKSVQPLEHFLRLLK
jgi:RNA polymerase sigma factor (sigma-70 family)